MSLPIRTLLASFALLTATTAATTHAEVLARFRGDFVAKEPAAGWRYLWNAKGEIGTAANYEPLKWSEAAKLYAPGTGKLPNPQPAAFLSLRALGGHAGRGGAQAPNKVDRYAIAAYTIPAGKSGVAWVADGELLRSTTKASEELNVPETVQLRIYLGDELKQTTTVSAIAEPTPFRVNVGDVQGGETIYVAVGPDGHDLTDGFEFDFRVHVLPAGQEPAASGLTIVPEDPGLPAVRRDKLGEPDPRFLKAHDENLAKAKRTADAQVVFIGDSITAGWGTGGKAVWTDTLLPLKPLNLGVGGDQTQHVLWHIEHGSLDGLNPKAVVLLIGTNNTGRYQGLEIAHGVEAVVKRIREKLPDAKLIITGIFPRGEKPTDPVRKKIALANEFIAKLADGKTIHYVDVGPQLLQPDGTISKETMPDFLHLAEPGYRAWANAVVPLVR